MKLLKYLVIGYIIYVIKLNYGLSLLNAVLIYNYIFAIIAVIGIGIDSIWSKIYEESISEMNMPDIFDENSLRHIISVFCLVPFVMIFFQLKEIVDKLWK